MRETYSTIRHLLHLATELDRACALFLSTHVSITHDEARVLLELGAAQHLLRPGALAKQLNLQPSTLSRVLRRYRQESCALFRQPHKPAVRCGYPSSRVTSR